MGQRTRIINDPAELVPLFQAFSSDEHMDIFREISEGWVSDEELEEKFGEDFEESVRLFKSAGLVKSNWASGEEGPVKEYATSYSDFRANFDCSIDDIAELVTISMEKENVLDNREDRIRELLRDTNGRVRMDELSDEISISDIGIRAIVKRSEDLRFHGNKVELLD